MERLYVITKAKHQAQPLPPPEPKPPKLPSYGRRLWPYRVATKAQLRAMPCEYCNGPGGTVDHYMPLSLGGDSVENLLPCCEACNLRKGSMHPDTWETLIANTGTHVGW